MSLPDIEATIKALDAIGTDVCDSGLDAILNAITLLRHMQKYRVRETAKEPPTRADAEHTNGLILTAFDDYPNWSFGHWKDLAVNPYQAKYWRPIESVSAP